MSIDTGKLLREYSQYRQQEELMHQMERKYAYATTAAPMSNAFYGQLQRAIGIQNVVQGTAPVAPAVVKVFRQDVGLRAERNWLDKRIAEIRVKL